jgi:hypothetical protein
MIFLTLYLLFTNKCFYKRIVNKELLDVTKRNKQKALCMNTFFYPLYFNQEIKGGSTATLPQFPHFNLLLAHLRSTSTSYQHHILPPSPSPQAPR